MVQMSSARVDRPTGKCDICERRRKLQGRRVGERVCDGCSFILILMDVQVALIRMAAMGHRLREGEA